MLFEVATTKSMEEIAKGLEESAAKHKFGIITVHNLKETMAKKGVDFAGECMIYEVCNPHQAKKVLEENGAVSTALPCRISVYRSGDEYRIATMLPSAMMQMFDSPGLAPIADEVEAVIKAMMEDAS
jgi:uncharacterized protein (DUF302 family)